MEHMRFSFCNLILAIQLLYAVEHRLAKVKLFQKNS